MDPYEILGIPKNATQEEIKKAYRREAMKWHPDRNNNSPDSQSRFPQAADSYKLLSEHNSRAGFDDFRTKNSDEYNYGGSDSEQSDYSSDSRYSSDKSEDNFTGEVFWEVMLDYAVKLAHYGMPEKEISVNLSRRGCPDSLATAIAGKALNNNYTSILLIAISCYAPFIFIALFANYFITGKHRK